ncbi:class I SAM-dependent methyltransferase [bacterium]|nr:class I SAM-dependent methyltransferase [bacterium]
MQKSLGPELFISKLGHPTFLKRLADCNNKAQPFRKAFGKLSSEDLIVDCTSGFGQDLLCLASWGAPTIGVERDSKVFAWLSEAIQLLAKTRPQIKKISSNLKLLNLNATEALSTLETEPTHIYLDPIYPEKEKSALGKLDLRLLKEHVGEDLDTSELLEAALKKASKRVIVKRPLKALEITHQTKPSLSAEGKSTRYDIYII